MDTKDELQKYEIQRTVKREILKVAVEQKLYYEIELEDVTEDEARMLACEIVKSENIEPDDIETEVLDVWAPRL